MDSVQTQKKKETKNDLKKLNINYDVKKMLLNNDNKLAARYADKPTNQTL
jgi:tricorn protease-like protein